MSEIRGRWTIEVDVDGLKGAAPLTIRFDPKTYNSVEHGYCITSTKSQGQEARRAGWIWDRTSDANMALVNLSRAVNEARGFYSRIDFPSVDDLAKHLGRNIVLKDDVQLLRRTIEKTGGPGTAWAKNVLAAMQRASRPLRQQYARECQAQDDSYRAHASALHDRARAARADAITPAQRAAATKSHSEQARILAATLQRHPTFSEWCVTNKARLETEQALRQDIDSRRDRRARAPKAEHVRKAARTRTPPDEHEWLAEQYRAKKQAEDLNLATAVRQELRELGSTDHKLPSHAKLVAQFEDLRTEIRREATERRYGPTKSEAKLMAEILYERGRSQRRGRGIG
jgi:hypothetical protein